MNCKVERMKKMHDQSKSYIYVVDCNLVNFTQFECFIGEALLPTALPCLVSNLVPTMSLSLCSIFCLVVKGQPTKEWRGQNVLLQTLYIQKAKLLLVGRHVNVNVVGRHVMLMASIRLDYIYYLFNKLVKLFMLVRYVCTVQ